MILEALDKFQPALSYVLLGFPDIDELLVLSPRENASKFWRAFPARVSKFDKYKCLESLSLVL